jgi:hypothetical protein
MNTYSCKVTQIGAGHTNEVMIWLVNQQGGEPKSWYKVRPEAGKEVLAIALSALNSDFPVEVDLESVAPGTVIDRLYIHR